MIKIVFTDVDGTLLDGIRGFPNLSVKNEYALKALLNKGIYVIISSGRSMSILNKEITDLKPSGYILSNGSHVELFGDVLNRIVMNEEQIAYLQKCTEENNGVGLYENQKGLYTTEKDSDMLKSFEKQWNMPLLKIQYKDKIDEEIYKILPVFKTEEDCDNFARMVDDSMDIRRQKGILAYDITPSGINKGAAVQMILDRLNISNGDAVAFGDNINDIEMLRTVGTGIAMANASIELKEIADDVTLDVLEDGFYHWLVNKGIIEKMEENHD